MWFCLLGAFCSRKGKILIFISTVVCAHACVRESAYVCICMCMHACMCVCLSHAKVGPRSDALALESWGMVISLMQVLRTELGSPRSAIHTLINYWAVSPATLEEAAFVGQAQISKHFANSWMCCVYPKDIYKVKIVQLWPFDVQ